MMKPCVCYAQRGYTSLMLAAYGKQTPHYNNYDATAELLVEPTALAKSFHVENVLDCQVKHA